MKKVVRVSVVKYTVSENWKLLNLELKTCVEVHAQMIRGFFQLSKVISQILDVGFNAQNTIF